MPFYTPSDNPSIFIDYDKCTPVSVIINFAPDGRMLPVFLHYIYPDQSEETLKIDGVISTKDIVGGVSYYCYITVNGWRRRIALTYYVKEHLWVINK